MKNTVQRHSIHTLRLLAAITALSTTSAVFATDLYFDNNGSTVGAGTATGAWDTTTSNWTTDSTGASTTQTWTNGDNAIFSAGTDASTDTKGAYTVTISGGVTVGNITQEEGDIRVTGGTITLASTGVTYDIQHRSSTGSSSDFDLRIDSTIADSGGGASSITKIGSGILHLVGNNTFSGGVTLNAGTLALESANALGAGTLTLNSGSLVRNYSSFTTANAINVQGEVKVGAIQQNSDWTLSGAWLTGSTNGVFNVSNTASDFNGFALSAMTIHITGDTSAYTGTFSINTLTSNANRLRFGPSTSGNFGTIDASNAKFATSGSTADTGQSSVIDVSDGAYGLFKMGQLSGTGGIIRSGYNASGGTTTFQIGALNTSTTFAGVINDNGTGKAAVEKVGTGTLTFSGTNNYTGATTVSAGTLAIGKANAISSSSALVLSGGTFASNGFSQTLNTLTLSNSSTLDFGSGTSALVFADSHSIAWSGTLTLLNFDIGTDSLSFSSVGGLTMAQLADINLAGYTATGLDANGFVQFTASAIPEPSTCAAIFGTIVLLGAAIRRRHRNA